MVFRSLISSIVFCLSSLLAAPLASAECDISETTCALEGKKCNIHFKFPDGSKIKRAFSYTWRLWTAPELRDMLLDAGFRNVTVYWEGEDDNGEGNGEFS